ncbi:MAG TPA: ribosomal-processing cysteine protease Prp [Clostridiaceae bacterium]|nr:ribosomal-processing cysteine protease Prp [Clostridiaceae bacterium]
MIRVKIVRDKEGFIWSFTIKGHAGYRKRGEDIVCAGVSAIAYTAVGALSELAGVNKYVEKDGYLKCSIPQSISDDKKPTIKIILETMAIGLKQLENSYSDYVVVEEEEV